MNLTYLISKEELIFKEEEKGVTWQYVKDTDNLYIVTTDGGIWSVRNNKYLKPKIDKDGYHEYTWSISGVRNSNRGHRLVAEAFIPNVDSLPQVNHKDENKQNNEVSNLEWCNTYYNTAYSVKGVTNEKILQVKPLHDQGYTHEQIIKKLDLPYKSTTSIYDILKGNKHSRITGIGVTTDTEVKNNVNILSESDIYQLLIEYLTKKYNVKELVKKYNSSKTTIYRIVQGKTYKDIYTRAKADIEGGICLT